MLDDKRLRFLINVANFEGLGLLLSHASSQGAAIDMNLAHQIAGGIKFGGNTSAEIDGVANETLVTGLESRHQCFAGVTCGIEDSDGAAVQRLAGGVG